jgi:hypothetical protein
MDADPGQKPSSSQKTILSLPAQTYHLKKVDSDYFLED